jgi:hypothetical protein
MFLRSSLVLSVLFTYTADARKELEDTPLSC